MVSNHAEQLGNLDDMKDSLEQFAQKHNLSKRELDVLQLLAQQVVSAEDISEKLGISRNTVRIHLKNINTKVGTNSKSELLGRFIEFVIQTKKEEDRLTGQSLTKGDGLAEMFLKLRADGDLNSIYAFNLKWFHTNHYDTGTCDSLQRAQP